MMRVRWRVLFAAMICGVLVTSDAVAQDPRLRERIPTEALAEVEAILSDARESDLPAEPLIDRALEGASKRAPPDRIVAAVRRLAGELAAARAALGPQSTEAEIVAGASALRAGAEADDLEQLRSRRSDQSLIVPAAVLADLVAVGVPVDTAVAAVLALADGFDDAQYIAFRRNVERDIGLGASPASAVFVSVEAALDFGLPSSSPGSSRPRKP